jgi:APA family basic amino acid/polyamine antiporter
MLLRGLFRIKPIDSELPPGERPLKRVLGPVDLIMLGIGGIVGAGIFALVGTAAAMLSGQVQDRPWSSPSS